MERAQAGTRVVELSAEEREALKALASSPFWAVYVKFLMRTEIEVRRAAGLGSGFDGMIDNWNRSGFAAGINFTITQLQALITDSDAKAKKVLEKQTEVKQPFRRG